jgi:hypothetical protein
MEEIMLIRRPALWISETAIFIALLVVAQVSTAQFTTFVTGSLVNLILITSVMTAGMSSGTTVAVVSPVLAKLLGIGPLWAIVPFIMMGNLVLVLVWHFIGNRNGVKLPVYAAYAAALVIAAVLKFGVIYLGIVKFMIPIVIGIPEPKASVMSAAFSLPQLATAAIGGALAILIVPPLKKALSRL